MNLETKDSKNYTPDLNLIGKVFTHKGNYKHYRIIGFSFNGSTDQWMVKHVETTNPNLEFIRTVDNFFDRLYCRN